MATNKTFCLQQVDEKCEHSDPAIIDKQIKMTKGDYLCCSSIGRISIFTLFLHLNLLLKIAVIFIQLLNILSMGIDFSMLCECLTVRPHEAAIIRQIHESGDVRFANQSAHNTIKSIHSQSKTQSCCGDACHKIKHLFQVVSCIVH